MKLIVGLGNPGRDYLYSRHNAGFMALDLLGEKLGISVAKRAFNALTGEGRAEGEKIVLMKPQTYMNLSGESVFAAVNWYKLPLEDLIVVYDDVDLPVGEIRVRPKGSAGTHNGMRNIIYMLQDDGFARVRVGIGKAKEGWDLKDHVLASFDKPEQEEAFKALKNAADAVMTILTRGMDEAQKAYNVKAAKRVQAREEDKAAPAESTDD